MRTPLLDLCAGHCGHDQQVEIGRHDHIGAVMLDLLSQGLMRGAHEAAAGEALPHRQLCEPQDAVAGIGAHPHAWADGTAASGGSETTGLAWHGGSPRFKEPCDHDGAQVTALDSVACEDRGDLHSCGS